MVEVFSFCPTQNVLISAGNQHCIIQILRKTCSLKSVILGQNVKLVSNEVHLASCHGQSIFGLRTHEGGRTLERAGSPFRVSRGLE